jgi:two-component system, cell cycle sensor histidine kinase and response regulator CckA
MHNLAAPIEQLSQESPASPAASVDIRDLTERKQIEQALRETEAKYHALIEHIPAITYVAALDDASSTLYVSPQVEPILGFKQAEWMADSRRWLKQLHPRDLGQVLADVLRSHADDAPFSSEFRMLTRDGRVVWFRDEAVIVRNGAGEPLFLQGIMIDITQRKQAEEALRESEEHYRLIAENTGDLISWLSREGLTIYASPSFRHILGYDPAELLSTSGFDLIHPEDVLGVLDTWRKLPDQGTVEATVRYHHADGSWRWVETRGTAVLRQGRSQLLIVGRDVTERKRLEAQFLQAQKMETIGQLAGGIAHDFNNMLCAVIGFLNCAQEQLAQDHPIRCDLDTAEGSAWRAAGLARQLLAFACKQVVEPRILNLNDVIIEMDKLLRRLIGDDIELITMPSPSLGQVNADPGQIEQVIANLVVNARDAMPNGGKLIIETAYCQLDGDYARQHVGVTPGEYVMLAVSDTGTGMDAQVQQRIFEPFFTTKEAGKGTGLGLATCYGIVKQYGGHIWLYSEVGYGTTFKVYLPRVTVAVDTLQPSAGDAVVPRGTETVLLVEDEPLVREIASHVLREQGYTVVEASNGGEALRVVQEYVGAPIALLVTDVVMPQLGGKAAAEQLAGLYPDIKVLFISGYATDAITRHGRLEPGTNFLSKPFTRAAFAHKVREVLDA